MNMQAQNATDFTHLVEREQQGMDMQDYIRFILRQRALLVLGLLLGLIAGATIALNQQPMFSSSMTLQFNEQQSGGMGMADLLGRGKSSAASAAIPVLKSRALAEQVVRRLALNAFIRENSDISFKKMLQRRLRGWVNPPPDMAGMGWTGKTRFYLGQLIGDPGPIGSIQMANLQVAPELAYRRFIIDLDRDGMHFKLLDMDGGMIAEGAKGIPLTADIDGKSLRFTVTDLTPGYASRLQVQFQSPLAAAKMVQHSLTIKPVGDGRSKYLELRCRWPDSVQAARILAMLAERYRQQDSAQGVQKTDQVIRFIDDNVKTMEQHIDDSEKAVKLFLSRHKLDITADSERAMARIADMETQRHELLLKRQQLDYIESRLKRASDSSYNLFLRPISDSLADDWSKLQAVQRKLEAEQDKMRGRFTPEYPMVREIKDALAGNRDAMALLKKQAGEAIGQKKLLLDKRARLLAGSIDRLEKNIGLDPEVQSQVMRLKRKSTVAEELYGFLLKKREEVRINKAGNMARAEVLDAALPGEQVSPRLRRSSLIGGMLGVLIAGLFGFVRERMDIGIKSVEELEQQSGLYVHGAIPKHKEAEEDSGLVTLTRWESVDAEAYRSLRTSIQLSSLEHQARTIFMTSSGPGEGKSTTGANLAVTLAMAGKKTLMVDCDMRKAVQHGLLNVAREPGLSEILAGELNWRDFVQTTTTANLSVLPAGSVPSNPSELLGREIMASLIEEVKEDYDFVLFDVPPILVVSDAALLAARVDGVLILVRSGIASIADVNRARIQMQRVGGHVLGAIFNSFDERAGGYGGYGRYGGYYSHDQKETMPSNPVMALWQRLKKKESK